MHDRIQEVSELANLGVESRRQRGREIARLAHIEQVDGFYVVPSQHNPRQTRYKVKYDGKNSTCTCDDFETRRHPCKHVYAVEFTLERAKRGRTQRRPTEPVEVQKVRKTYPQNWPAYNDAQTNEKREFQRLLRDLCANVPEPVVATDKPRRGRPPIPRADAIFAAVFKVYSLFSARRFTSDLCDAQAKGYIAKVPHFNSVLNALEDPELFPILTDLIIRASLPLRAVESSFAVDSTGFTSCRFVRWYDVKYNKFTAEQQWVKAHMVCGVKTNIVTAVEIHGRDTNDCPVLPSLVDTTAQNFAMAEVSADKGYSARETHDAIAKHGATPFIAFKSNTTGGVGGLFQKMYHYFQFRRDEFLAHYHRRSNIESTVMMIKSKFGDSLRSKTDAAMRNETLAKVLCHNLCCLIHAVRELQIDVTF